MSEPTDDSNAANDSEQAADEIAERRRVIADYVESLRELIRKLRGPQQ
jgi:hypothetical protein